jgi:hypothetical protein
MRWVPPRWRTKGWLDPRPYFSRQWLKGLYQQTESAIRWRYRNLLLRAFGGTPATPPADFERGVRAVVDVILRQTDAAVLLLTPAGINGRYYPGTPASMNACAAACHAVAGEHTGTGRVAVADTSGLLDRRSDFLADGFHPNREGHRKLAALVEERIGTGIRHRAVPVDSSITPPPIQTTTSQTHDGFSA